MDGALEPYAAPDSWVADVDFGDAVVLRVDAATEDDDVLERALILALFNTVD
jgi:hypothetical protein